MYHAQYVVIAIFPTIPNGSIRDNIISFSRLLNAVFIRALVPISLLLWNASGGAAIIYRRRAHLHVLLNELKHSSDLRARHRNSCALSWRRKAAGCCAGFCQWIGFVNFRKVKLNIVLVQQPK